MKTVFQDAKSILRWNVNSLILDLEELCEADIGRVFFTEICFLEIKTARLKSDLESIGQSRKPDKFIKIFDKLFLRSCELVERINQCYGRDLGLTDSKKFEFSADSCNN